MGSETATTVEAAMEENAAGNRHHHHQNPGDGGGGGGDIGQTATTTTTNLSDASYARSEKSSGSDASFGDADDGGDVDGVRVAPSCRRNSPRRAAMTRILVGQCYYMFTIRTEFTATEHLDCLGGAGAAK